MRGKYKNKRNKKQQMDLVQQELAEILSQPEPTPEPMAEPVSEPEPAPTPVLVQEPLEVLVVQAHYPIPEPVLDPVAEPAPTPAPVPKVMRAYISYLLESRK